MTSRNHAPIGSFGILPRVQPLLADVEVQLTGTDHFGILGELLQPGAPRTSRYEYVVRQCAMLHRIKSCVRGLGLGSSNNFPQSQSSSGNDWSSLKQLTGLEVCQAWAVLLNAGHLFGTFATERPLLFELDRTLALRETFVAGVSEIDREVGKPFRTLAERMLDRAALHSFHNLFASWRLRDGGPSSLPDADRRCARLLILAFLQPPTEKVKALRALYKRVRQLVYLNLHGALRLTGYSLPDFDEKDLKLLFPEDALPEADWGAASRWQVYDAIDSDDADSLFASSMATGDVLAHVAEFKRWWSSSTLDLEERLDALFTRPADWPASEPKRLRQFLELRVPSALGWLHEVRHWHRDDDEKNPWKGSDFFITPSVRDLSLRVELYSSEAGLATDTLRHICVQLGRPFAGLSEHKYQHALWMSTARLAARAFESILSVGHRVRLRPVAAEPGHLGYATAGATYEFVRGRVKGFLAVATDLQRARELRQLLAIADEVVGWRSTALLLLARTEVLSNRPEQKTVTDLDGVIGYWLDGALYWLVVETKKTGSSNGAKQLRENFIPALADAPSGEIQSRTFGHDESWFVQLRSPDRILTRQD